MIDLKLWPNGEHATEIHLSIPEKRSGDGAVIVFPGGGYRVCNFTQAISSRESLSSEVA